MMEFKKGQVIIPYMFNKPFLITKSYKNSAKDRIYKGYLKHNPERKYTLIHNSNDKLK